MKKFLFILSLIFVVNATSANSKCSGGNVFEGTQNGHEYCVSKGLMTWWAAFAWCQHQGRHLASLQEACDGWDKTQENNVCGNLIKTGIYMTFWTANPYDARSVYDINTQNGNMGAHGRDSGLYALCY